MEHPTLTSADLAHFTGSENYYRHPLNRKCVFTDGVQFLAERAGAYWLLDEILLIQPYAPALRAAEFQVWTLSVRADRTATLSCENGNGGLLYSKEIGWTDFPLPSIELWFANNTLYLPSEH